MAGNTSVVYHAHIKARKTNENDDSNKQNKGNRRRVQKLVISMSTAWRNLRRRRSRRDATAESTVDAKQKRKERPNAGWWPVTNQ